MLMLHWLTSERWEKKQFKRKNKTEMTHKKSAVTINQSIFKRYTEVRETDKTRKAKYSSKITLYINVGLIDFLMLYLKYNTNLYLYESLSDRHY